MAPVKFDENIKNKLEKRTLQPSSDAWNTLSEQLDAHDKKNSRSLFFYIGIAASIVGVLFVTTLFFKASEEQQSVSPTVVETELIEDINRAEPVNSLETVANSSKDIIETNQETKEKVSPIQSSTKNEPKVAAISEENKTKSPNQKQPLDIIKTQESIASVNKLNTDKKVVTPLNKLTFEQVKANEVVAIIKSMEAEGAVITDAEIEDLLKQAEKEILRERIYNEITRTVDADALLQDVEDDLEQSFRTRVFESLKSSYKTVKTAVAERNN